MVHIKIYLLLVLGLGHTKPERDNSDWLSNLENKYTRREMEVTEKLTTKSRGRTHTHTGSIYYLRA